MKAVIQRVSSASVTVNEKKISEISNGILTFLGIEKGDTEEQLKKIIEKIIHLRIFEDTSEHPHARMNLSLQEVRGEHLIVSQFTIAGDCSKGRRPSFSHAESPERARDLYEKAIHFSQQSGIKTTAGQFQTDMKVSLVNNGPVTFILDS